MSNDPILSYQAQPLPECPFVSFLSPKVVDGTSSEEAQMMGEVFQDAGEEQRKKEDIYAHCSVEIVSTEVNLSSSEREDRRKEEKGNSTCTVKSFPKARALKTQRSTRPTFSFSRKICLSSMKVDV
jgi:hypothetical protein